MTKTYKKQIQGLQEVINDPNCKPSDYIAIKKSDFDDLITSICTDAITQMTKDIAVDGEY